MGVVSGIAAAVNHGSVAATVREWSIDLSNSVAEWIASGSETGSSSLAGNTDWSGQYSAYGAIPEILPGDSFTFTGSIDGTEGVVGAAICSQVEITWPIEDGGVISHTVSFEANGVLDRTGGVAIDSSVPDPPSAIGCILKASNAGGSPAEVNDIREMSLTLTSNNPAYVSSSTSAQTKRVVGNKSMSASYTRYVSELDDLPVLGTDQEWNMYYNGSDFWTIQWVRISDVGGITVDIESAELVGATVNGVMMGFDDTEGQGAISVSGTGSITWWPPA